MKSLLLSRTRMLTSAALAFSIFAAAATASAQTYLHDELRNGDLSDDFDVPDSFVLPDGSSFLRLDLNSADVDLFTLHLPKGRQLDQLIVRDYQSTTGNISFLGFQVGDQLSAPPSSNFADPIDYVIFGEWAINEDILPLTVQTNPALTVPLTESSLAFWANETGAASSFVLEFRTSSSPIPEPSTPLLLGGSAFLSLLRRRKRPRTSLAK